MTSPSIDRTKFGALLFEEEFNSPPPAGRWSGTYNWGYYNGKPTKTSYVIEGDGSLCSMEPECVVISGGMAQMTAKKGGSRWGMDWSAPLLRTTQSFSPGCYIEGRMRFPRGQGFWPGFWLDGPVSTMDQHQTLTGEIDIVEALMGNPLMHYMTLHWNSEKAYLQRKVSRLDLSNFVTYGCLWAKDAISFYQDDVQVATVPWEAAWAGSLDVSMQILLDLSVGGNWGGPPDPSLTEGLMQVDWIRVHAYDA